MRKYFKINVNENKTHKKFWMQLQLAERETYRLDIHNRKEERPKPSYVMFYFKKQLHSQWYQKHFKN